MTNQDRDFPYPGARWWKFDLHTHTPASEDYGKGRHQASLRRITPRDWLLGYMRAGLDCVAVTDHNSGAWVDCLKEALLALEQDGHEDFRPLVLFPGVEITANGGLHVLAIFNLDRNSTDVSLLVGSVNEGKPITSHSAAKCSVIEVVEAICEAGAVPILAHVDRPGGVWARSDHPDATWALGGSSLAPLLEVEGLFALEVVNPSHEKPPLYRERKLSWAEVIGSDSHHPTSAHGTHFPGSRYTWIKMAGPSLEGLRLALLDGGDFSVRRSDASGPFDPFAIPKNLIEAIEIEDARYMGRGTAARVTFSPWLNALVGGRGTGKSTILHALRLAARRQSELDDLEDRGSSRSTFREFDRVPKDRRDRGGLTESTAVRWLVRRDDVLYRVLWRQDARGVVVEYRDDDHWAESPSQAVTPQRFPLRLFSQGQIAELAGENQALLRVVDDAADEVVTQRRRLDEACAAFSSLRARIREIDQRLRHEDVLLVELQDVERKLKRFEDAGHQTLLMDYRRRERQRRVAEHQLDSAKAAAERVDATARTLGLDDVPGGVFSVADEDQQAVAVLARFAASVGNTANNLHDEATRLRRTIAEQEGQLARSAWQSFADKAASDYQTLIRRLRAAGVTDLSEYDKLIQDRALLEDERKRLDSMREERDRLISESNEQRAIALEARRTISAARADFLSDALAGNRFVRVAVRSYGYEQKVVERSLRQQLDIMDDRFENDILSEDGKGGVVAELLNELPDEDKRRVEEFERRIEDLKSRIESACAGNGDFQVRFNKYFEREFNRKPELLDKLLMWFPEDDLVVEYSLPSDGTGFRPISQASAGQRSAAMLAFLLAHGDEPLVLDQPEDDLDNHLIYDLVVRQIRENKLRRQIIVVTHNPNIVVNGDAEMVYALRSTNGQCVVGKSGSLQDSEIREEVCQIMEGGREAFSRRFRRLGREPRDV